MPLPTAIKYGREASQPPNASNIGNHNRPVINCTPTTGQPYKFGGKELITSNGLNEYDFGARQYYSAVPVFTRIDPMAEKYPWLSPYLYCANNPVNAIDPDGRELFFTGGSESDYNQICSWLTNITDGQYIFSYSFDKDLQTAKVAYEVNKDFKKSLSDNRNAVNLQVKEMIDNVGAVTVNIDSNSNQIIIGDVRKKTIDITDMINIGNRFSITSESALLHELYEQFILQTHGWEKDEKRIGQAHEAASIIESQYMNMSISPRRVFESSCGSYKIEDIYQLEIPYNVDGIFLDIYPLTEIIKIKNGAIIKR